MTRKRKVVNDDTAGEDPLSGYGYVHQPAAAFSKPSTPATHNRRHSETSQVENKRARWGASSDARVMNDYHKEEPLDNEPSDKNSFPTELVSYLRHIASTLSNEEPDQLILTKCLEECDGEEVNLLGYQESCRLLETIFGRSKFGAFGFLKKLNRLKRVKWLNLIYNGCSARTIETLLLALQPIDERSLEEVVTGWKDLVVDDWNNLVMDANGIHLIRSLARLLLGLPKADTKAELKSAMTASKPKFANTDVEKQLRRDFEQLNNLALDYGSMKDYIGRPTVSLLVQDFAEMDACLKCGQCRQFVIKALENPDEIEEWWKDKEASRVWEKLVSGIDEDLRQTLFASALSGRLRDLAAHKYANYPLQRMISLSKSEESVTDILEMTEDFETLLDKQRSGVVIAVLQCVANHEEEQERVIKALRQCFHAEKKRSKLHFAPNVLCLNSADVSEENSSIRFNVSSSTLQGSLLVQHLLNLHHHKSILGSLLAVSAECLMEMAKHPLASHAIDSAFRSKKIPMQDKLQLAQKFDWVTLVGDKYGSRVFEAYWELADVPIESRERILESLARSNSESKSPVFRLICNKLKVKEFAQNRNLWRQNLTRQATAPAPQRTKLETKAKPQPNTVKALPVNNKPASSSLSTDASAATTAKRQGRKRGGILPIARVKAACGAIESGCHAGGQLPGRHHDHRPAKACLLHNILSTPEDPELTFEHLYQFGKNEYTSKNWHDCISFLLRATEDYRYYRDETIWCRQKCAMQISEIPPTINASTETVASIRLICRAEKFTPQRPPLSNYAIYEEFQNRRQYHYLQYCHWKMGDLRSAVKSAFTHLVANPDNQESLDNVKFYMTQPGYNEDMLVDALQMQYEKYYISGTEAYNAGEWQRCITDFQESLKLFFEEEQECRMMCEDNLDWSSLEGDNPETSIVIT
ncbi:hypothetical protein AAVH_32856, partial [Aphelenchoides avenae]